MKSGNTKSMTSMTRLRENSRRSLWAIHSEWESSVLTFMCSPPPRLGRAPGPVPVSAGGNLVLDLVHHGPAGEVQEDVLERRLGDGGVPEPEPRLSRRVHNILEGVLAGHDDLDAVLDLRHALDALHGAQPPGRVHRRVQDVELDDRVAALGDAALELRRGALGRYLPLVY